MNAIMQARDISIRETEENIRRINSTIRNGEWQNGYTANLQTTLAEYEETLKELQDEQRADTLEWSLKEGMQRSFDQWSQCNPEMMATKQSDAAIAYALADAQKDIAFLRRKLLEVFQESRI